MKPEFAMDLPTPSDLSPVSVSEALRMLQKKLDPKWDRRVWYYLKVPSQTAPDALFIANGFGVDMSVQLDCGFGPDEWALKAMAVGDGVDSACVWSPGA